MEFVPCLLYRQYDFLHGKSGFVSKKRDFVVITQQSPRFFCFPKEGRKLQNQMKEEMVYGNHCFNVDAGTGVFYAG